MLEKYKIEVYNNIVKINYILFLYTIGGKKCLNVHITVQPALQIALQEKQRVLLKMQIRSAL